LQTRAVEHGHEDGAANAEDELVSGQAVLAGTYEEVYVGEGVAEAEVAQAVDDA